MLCYVSSLFFLLSFLVWKEITWEQGHVEYTVSFAGTRVTFIWQIKQIKNDKGGKSPETDIHTHTQRDCRKCQTLIDFLLYLDTEMLSNSYTKAGLDLLGLIWTYCIYIVLT